ncbi:hypothetical protein DRQ53_00565 [bacterium]|nr:MAG: hypothetical protein DRQ32_02255 [bacterium]RKZ18382.1 MAG: hypothetical protein DRQ53_00565 [bacterium]
MESTSTPDALARVTLGLFVKEALPGMVKTRLARSIGDTQAAALYKAFVVDSLTLALNSAAGHCRIFHAGAAPSGWAGLDWPTQRMSEVPQSDGDLGMRLDGAFQTGPCPMLILGSDSPDLPATYLHSALQALAEGAEVVLGAAGDGGVWCIGLDRHHPGFFDALPWSSPDTGDALRNRADSSGLKRAEVHAWYDCDLQEDLDALITRLRREPDGATMTRRWLDLSSPKPAPESP